MKELLNDIAYIQDCLENTEKAKGAAFVVTEEEFEKLYKIKGFEERNGALFRDKNDKLIAIYK